MTDESVCVERYTYADREAAHAFLRAALAPEHAERLIRQWAWKYDGNPFNPGPGPYILLLKDGARIVGLMGDLSVPLSIHGTVHPGYCSCDLTILEDHRRRGLSRWIIRRHMADHDLAFAWLNVASHRAAAPLADSTSMPVRPLVLALDLEAAVTTWASRMGLAAGATLLTRAAGRVARLAGPAPARDVTVSGVTMPDERFDALSRRAARDVPVMLLRDRRYLEWRFFQRPDATYRLVAALRGDALLGYLVMRRASRAGVPCGYLVDVLADRESPPIVSALARHAIDEFRRDGVAVVVCLVNRPAYRRALAGLGFMPWRWGAQSYFYARVDAPDPGLHVVRDTRRWLVTLSDGDVEMAF